jgi:hypothetical protein
MRRVLAPMVAAAVGIALASCEAREPANVQSAAPLPMGTEPLAPITRSSLSPPVGYADPSPLNSSPTPLVPRPTRPNEEAGSVPDGWRASPRWAAVQGNGCIEVQSEASKYRVENCSQEAADDPPPPPPEDNSGY